MIAGPQALKQARLLSLVRHVQMLGQLALLEETRLRARF